MTEESSSEAVARLFRQRLEMGAGDLVLDRLTRREALAMAGTVRSAGVPVSRRTSGPTIREERESSSRRESSSGRASSSRRESSSESVASAQPAAAKTPDSSPGEDLPALPDDYDALRDEAMGCLRCPLSEHRTQVVFSDGPRDARVMVVGEAPGANEDRTGVPFVGAAGKYLDLLLATVGLDRQSSVYIANVLKCRPPGNRDPRPEEIASCSPYLLRQIELVRPEALLAVGSFSGKLLTGRDKVALGKLRGEVHSYHGVPLVVTYHPAALLRNSNWTRLFWDDLQLLRQVLDSSPASG